MSINKKHTALKRRQKRGRRKISGTSDRLRLCVTRSNKNIVAQLIDDEKGETLVSASSHELKSSVTNTGNLDAATQVGSLIGKRASDKGLKAVVLDRAGRKFHGRVAALAEAARKEGLEF